MPGEPKLPEGAADWEPPTDAEIALASTITQADIDAAKERVASRGGLLDDLLSAKEYEG